MLKLSGSHLLGHVQKFAGAIGPRPAGHATETKARNTLQAYLQRLGVTTEQLSFSTTDTWGYGTISPPVLALLSTWLPARYRFFKATLNLIAAHQFWLTLHGQLRDHLFYRFYPQYHGGTLLAYISPPTGGQAESCPDGTYRIPPPTSTPVRWSGQRRLPGL